MQDDFIIHVGPCPPSSGEQDASLPSTEPAQLPSSGPQVESTEVCANLTVFYINHYMYVCVRVCSVCV